MGVQQVLELGGKIGVENKGSKLWGKARVKVCWVKYWGKIGG